jgi:hypothetical protein
VGGEERSTGCRVRDTRQKLTGMAAGAAIEQYNCPAPVFHSSSHVLHKGICHQRRKSSMRISIADPWCNIDVVAPVDFFFLFLFIIVVVQQSSSRPLVNGERVQWSQSPRPSMAESLRDHGLVSRVPTRIGDSRNLCDENDL